MSALNSHRQRQSRPAKLSILLALVLALGPSCHLPSADYLIGLGPMARSPSSGYQIAFPFDSELDESLHEVLGRTYAKLFSIEDTEVLEMLNDAKAEWERVQSELDNLQKRRINPDEPTEEESELFRAVGREVAASLAGAYATSDTPLVVDFVASAGMFRVLGLRGGYYNDRTEAPSGLSSLESKLQFLFAKVFEHTAEQAASGSAGDSTDNTKLNGFNISLVRQEPPKGIPLETFLTGESELKLRVVQEFTNSGKRTQLPGEYRVDLRYGVGSDLRAVLWGELLHAQTGNRLATVLAVGSEGIAR